eukprot:COSAG06_NODE_508_length_14925_cov_18.648995_15_plen_50_part_00
MLHAEEHEEHEEEEEEEEEVELRTREAETNARRATRGDVEAIGQARGRR